MTTILTLALLNKANDAEYIKELKLPATRETVDKQITDFGWPALRVLLEDTEDAAGTLGEAEVRVGENSWLRAMREDRPPGYVRDTDLGQIGKRGRWGGKVIVMKMRVIRNGPETG